MNGIWIYSAPGNRIQIREHNPAVVDAVATEDAGLIAGIRETGLNINN